MASIESLGLGSGVLTSDLVDNIINAEKEASELRLNRQQELVETKITAYGEIKSLMSNLQSATSALASPSAVSSTSVASSNETILTATSSSLADPGRYNIDVLNTAKNHALVTGSFAGFNDVVGSGQLVISFGEISYDNNDQFVSQTTDSDQASITIDIDESNQTLSGIRDAINNSDAGVTASIVNDGSGFRLLLNANTSGNDGAMRIAALDSNGDYLSGGLAQLGFNEFQQGDSNLQQTRKAEDAEINFNGLTLTRSSNQIDDVIKGVTLNLKSADIGNTVTVDVSADTSQLVENMQSFVDAYNGLKVFTDELTGYNAELQQGGLLLGDSTLRTMLFQVRSLISQPIVGLGNAQFRSLTELGVDTNRNNSYLLDFRPDEFVAAVNAERDTVVGLLAKSGRSDDSLITYVNDSIKTQAGSYQVELTQLASRATFESGSLDSLDFANPVEINDSNRGFSINVNGTNAEVQLTRGSYTSGEQLARELTLQINSTDALRQQGHSVSVAYQETSLNFSISSTKYGADSQVYFTNVGASTANTLGFSTLSSGTYYGAELTTINAEAFAGRGAQTAIGNRTLDSDQGIDFATSNASFSLAVDGLVPVPVVVNQNASGVDLNGDGVFGDRQDTLQAIQTALDSSALNGLVNASFDDEGYLRFTTTAEGSSKSIEISTVGSSSTDQILGLVASQGVQNNGKDPGLTTSEAIDFRVTVDGITATDLVSIPAATYATGNDLAAAVQQQMTDSLASDSAFSGVVRGAATDSGSRDLSTAIDFAATPVGFQVNVSGSIQEIVLDDNSAALTLLSPINDPLAGDSTTNLAVIQQGLDDAFGSGVVEASLAANNSGNQGLVLTTVATGHQQYIEVTSDGRGARTSEFADISSGIDFSGSNNQAEFTLTLDGVDLAVQVTGNGSSGSNDTSSNLTVIQQALDQALVASGQFSAGDIVAGVNSSNQLYFETVSRQGVKTAATFGSAASVSISGVNDIAQNQLGISAESQTNGYDGVGIAADRQFGYDLDAVVDYVYDADSDLGSLQIQIGGEGTSISFSDLDPLASSILGLQNATDYQPAIATGKDAAGTINGVEATGTGQFLSASDGNKQATPGFYLATQAVDFSTPLVLDDTNNSFTIELDGVSAEISLSQPATYVSGSALASAMQTAINNNATLQQQSLSVKVDYTDDPESFAHQKIGIISTSRGADSRVEIGEISTAAANAFGFARGIGDGEAGRDASGEVNPASGIRLKVLGGALGQRGNITYVSGFADQLNGILTSFLNIQSGTLTNKENALQADLESIADDRTQLEERIAAQEKRLKAQFLFNDKIISTLNTTLDFVKTQFEAMTNTMKNK